MKKIEYFMWSEKTPVLVLNRKSNMTQTEKCGFCGHKHEHGTDDGHRVAHCGDDAKIEITAHDGTILKRSNGYVIRTNYNKYIEVK